MEQLRAHTPAKWTGSLLGPMFPCTAYVGFTHSHYVYNTTNDEITRMHTRTPKNREAAGYKCYRNQCHG